MRATTTMPLDDQIVTAWEKASATLRLDHPDSQEVAALIALLRDCAVRSGAIGFANGEKELLRMAAYLEGRISQSDYPRYETN